MTPYCDKSIHGSCMFMVEIGVLIIYIVVPLEKKWTPKSITITRCGHQFLNPG